MAQQNARIHTRKPVLSSGPGTCLPKSQMAATETCRRLACCRGIGLMPPAHCDLPQQGQYTLWQLVGLGHHGRAGLLQDLGTRQVGGFCREVGVQNA